MLCRYLIVTLEGLKSAIFTFRLRSRRSRGKNLFR